MNVIRNPFLSLLFLISFIVCSCSSDTEDEIRMPDDIMGIWETDDNRYLEFSTGNIVKVLNVVTQDGERIGKWGYDEVYYYEPGYNLVIYLSSEHEANVYQIVSFYENAFTWCWVYNIEVTGKDSIGQVIGDIINKAQEGFTLEPELYQNFSKISEDNFLEMLESLEFIYYPWEY